MTNSWFSLRRVFDFKGRSSRREYLLLNFVAIVMFAAPMALIGSLLPAAGDPTQTESPLLMAIFVVWCLVSPINLIVLIAVAVRRVHDHDKSGLYLLLGCIPVVGWIIALVLAFTPGDEHDNRFGPNPRYPIDEPDDLDHGYPAGPALAD